MKVDELRKDLADLVSRSDFEWQEWVVEEPTVAADAIATLFEYLGILEGALNKGGAEMSYRRGATQGMSFAYDWIEAGNSLGGLAALCNLSMELRYQRNGKVGPFLDTLRRRYREIAGKEKKENNTSR